MSIVGKWFCHMGPGAEYMHTGRVVAQVDAMVLIEIEHCDHIPKTMNLLPLTAIVARLAKDGSIESDWEFFADRAELDAWIKWLDAPPEDGPAEKQASPLN